MKKLIALCLVFGLMLPLCACGKGEGALRREKMTQTEAEWIPSERETVVLETALPGENESFYGSYSTLRTGQNRTEKGDRIADHEITS